MVQGNLSKMFELGSEDFLVVVVVGVEREREREKD